MKDVERKVSKIFPKLKLYQGTEEMAEATDVGAPGLAQFTEVWGNLCGSCLEKGNSLMR